MNDQMNDQMNDAKTGAGGSNLKFELISHERADFRESMLRQIPPGTSRRDFLQLMGAVIVMGSLEGCREHDPIEEVIPYARTPETALNGPYTHFATSIQVADSILGVRVTAHQGRPIKIEGNPLHPFGRGSTNTLAQGALYDLYDPHRAAQITYAGEEPRDWPQFRRALALQLAQHPSGLRIIVSPLPSPTDRRLLDDVLKKYPSARVSVCSSVPLGASALRDFSKADTVVVFDDERFGFSAEGLREARDWMERRSLDRPDFARSNKSARLFVAEPQWTFAGGVADERIPVRRSRIPLLLQALSGEVAGLNSFESEWVTHVRSAMKAGTVLFGAGPAQSREVHARLAELNRAHGDLSRAPTADVVTVTETQTLKDLALEMKAGTVETLLIIGANPVFEAPADLDFETALKKTKFTVALSSYVNETSRLCTYQIPLAHDLEMWGDYTNADGSVGIVQPLIAPLYNGRTAKELLSVCLEGELGRDAYTLTRETWKQARKEFDFESWWRQQLTSGVSAVGASAPKSTRKAAAPTPAPESKSYAAPEALSAGLFEAIFVPDLSLYDGRYANNAWLQELPRPFSEITWDNCASVSTETAQKLKLATGDLVKISAGESAIVIPVFVQSGLPEDQFILPLGYGSKTTGIGAGVGVNVGVLRTSENVWSRSNVKVEKTGQRYALAITQKGANVEDDKVDRVVTPAKLALMKDAFSAGVVKDPETPRTLDNRPQRWGMVIDLDTCIGCKVCTIACQVENNIPVVGKKQVLMGREMHWIRIDRYTRGEGAKTKFDAQPVPCMQCEKAPCEVVCPVNASVHSSDGLNQQVYNRCIGTRFCANNCPYKVRRFNFLKYTGFDKEPALREVYNPDVTVRWRGVMEKCTYCVQRINRARLESEIAHTAIGKFETACQQACPTKAIVFGDLDDDTSLVKKLKQLPREYTMLEELGTKPRTTYLAKTERP